MKERVLFRLLMLLWISTTPAFAQTVIQAANPAALTSAINTIPDGGVIELTSAVYASPANGFVINDSTRSFTIRGAAGVNPILDGGNARVVLRVNGAAPIIFDGLTFRNGLSTTFNDRSGGVSLKNTSATFVDCNFLNNVTNPAVSGGGGVQMSEDSEAFFVGCTWQGNTSRNFGGGLVVFESTAWVHNSQIIDNLTNVASHVPLATGGGISATASDAPGAAAAKLRVTNTRFEGNEAGFAGGALYTNARWVAPVSVPRVDTIVANCAFEDNLAIADPGIATPSPQGGGAINVEDQTTTRIYNSRFFENQAEIAGGVNVYRSIVEIHDSVFRGNQATGSTRGGFGGSVSATSNDTGADGGTNRRTTSMLISDSLLQGRFGTVAETGQIGGCVYIGGDVARQYGLGITQISNLTANRATIDVERSAFMDCDANELRPGGGVGGGAAVDLSNLDVADSLVAGSDADIHGGAFRPASQSAVSVSDSFLAANTAGGSGGGIQINASDLTVSDSTLVENNAPSGGAIRADPNANVFGQGIEVDVNGTVAGNTISNNTGGTQLAEVDFNNGPINDLRYNSNTFFGTTEYTNSIAGSHNAASLNTLTVVRSGAANTAKSQVNNTAAGSAPVRGEILAVPPQILPTNAAGEAGTATESFLAYAWSGGAATVDGGTVTGDFGTVSAGVGTHTLSVAGTDFTAPIAQGVAPNATFTASPQVIPEGGTATLNWAVTSGTFLDMAIDQRLSPTTPTAAGSVDVSPSETATYRLFVTTEQGGVVKEVTVFVGEGILFTDDFESGGTINWATTVTP